MPDRARGTPDTSRSRLRDDACPGLPGVASTGPPDPASPAAPEELGALASPTLAALYASQGHGEMAAAVYEHLREFYGRAAAATTPLAHDLERGAFADG